MSIIESNSEALCTVCTLYFVPSRVSTTLQKSVCNNQSAICAMYLRFSEYLKHSNSLCTTRAGCNGHNIPSCVKQLHELSLKRSLDIFTCVWRDVLLPAVEGQLCWVQLTGTNTITDFQRLVLVAHNRQQWAVIPGSRLSWNSWVTWSKLVDKLGVITAAMVLSEMKEIWKVHWLASIEQSSAAHHSMLLYVCTYLLAITPLNPNGFWFLQMYS